MLVEITTPFLDRHNDYIQLYIINQNDTLTISDDGYTLNDLQMTGSDVNEPFKQLVLEKILQKYSVSKNDKNELFVTTDINNLLEKENNLIQAILFINDFLGINGFELLLANKQN